MYTALARIEERLADIEVAALRVSYLNSRSTLIERAKAIEAIPGFWSTVIDEAPAEIDGRIQPRDVPVLNCLKAIDVERYEVQNEANGEPRSIKLTFSFKPNQWFHDDKIEKHFSWRMSKKGWSGLVSEPVTINWKGRDLTDGLLDMAVSLRKKEQELEANGQERGLISASKEYALLVEKAQRTPQDAISVFALFGFRGHRVTAEESTAAIKMKKDMVDGVQEWRELDEESPPLPDTEIYPHGEEVAIALSEDLYPGATQYFTAAKERDANLSDEDPVSESGSEDQENGVDYEANEQQPSKRMKLSR
ncbi:MAG: hypothetical protein Q9174_001399 [Haloplaca sp. 1 TL-2023]